METKHYLLSLFILATPHNKNGWTVFISKLPDLLFKLEKNNKLSITHSTVCRVEYRTSVITDFDCQCCQQEC